jgi:hypothetical protein
LRSVLSKKHHYFLRSSLYTVGGGFLLGSFTLFG